MSRRDGSKGDPIGWLVLRFLIGVIYGPPVAALALELATWLIYRSSLLSLDLIAAFYVFGAIPAALASLVTVAADRITDRPIFRVLTAVGAATLVCLICQMGTFSFLGAASALVLSAIFETTAYVMRRRLEAPADESGTAP
jgi:hypothetical protein